MGSYCNEHDDAENSNIIWVEIFKKITIIPIHLIRKTGVGVARMGVRWRGAVELPTPDPVNSRLVREKPTNEAGKAPLTINKQSSKNYFIGRLYLRRVIDVDYLIFKLPPYYISHA